MERDQHTHSTIFRGVAEDEESGAVDAYRCVLCLDEAGAFSLDWTWLESGDTIRIIIPAGHPTHTAWASLFPRHWEATAGPLD